MRKQLEAVGNFTLVMDGIKYAVGAKGVDPEDHKSIERRIIELNDRYRKGLEKS